MDQQVFNGIQEELLADEGLRLKVYDDATGLPIGPGTLVKGNPTIAIGRNLSGNGLTRDECFYLNTNDINACYEELSAQCPWLIQMTLKRQIALCSLYFNVSLHNAAKFVSSWPNLIAQLERGAYDEAADNLESSQPWASEVGPRAKRLGEMFRFG